ncbi:MAG: hypothetical protein AAF403_03835 [Pseudomonadota bacterium]
MIILPTYKRPDNIKHFIKNAIEYHTKNTITLAINQDDNSYDHIDFPDFMMIVKIPSHYKAASAFQYIRTLFPNEPWYAMLADDVIIKTKDWDSKLADAAMKNHLAYPTNSENGLANNGHAFFSNQYISAVDGPNYLNFDHFATDLYMEYFAHRMFEDSKDKFWIKDIVCDHISERKRKKDETYYRTQTSLADKLRWIFIRQHEYIDQLYVTFKRRFYGEKIDLAPIPKYFQKEHFFRLCVKPTYQKEPKDSPLARFIKAKYPEIDTFI